MHIILHHLVQIYSSRDSWRMQAQQQTIVSNSHQSAHSKYLILDHFFQGEFWVWNVWEHMQTGGLHTGQHKRHIMQSSSSPSSSKYSRREDTFGQNPACLVDMIILSIYGERLLPISHCTLRCNVVGFQICFLVSWVDRNLLLNGN